jgi:hypothetical protein
MTISFPLSMPTDVIGISNIELRADNVVGVTQSPFTYRQQVFQYSGQRWSAAIDIAPVNREFGEPWVAFLLALNGPAGTFLLGDPLGACSRGLLGGPGGSTWFLADGVWRSEGEWLDEVSWDETADDIFFVDFLVDGPQAVGASEIDVKGLPISRNGVLKAGDYVQFGAAATATLHKVLLDVSSDASGEATLHIWPAMRRALVDEEPVVYENARGRFRLASNQQAWSIANNLRYGISFEAVEVVTG